MTTRIRIPTTETTTGNGHNDDYYSPAAIRVREEGRAILAVRTPGLSFCSLTFIFPRVGICASGYALPLENEDDYNDETDNVSRGGGIGGGGGGGGPALYVR
jgi:hypothetical protein